MKYDRLVEMFVSRRKTPEVQHKIGEIAIDEIF
jgi:hypothetical protein